MVAISNKLKSNSGATLMMALLFFVVCAVTGSMILLSATAAAGRLKGMKTSDQNYYAVYSATKMVEKQLLSEQIEAREVLTIVERTNTHASDDEDEEDRTTYDPKKPEFYLGTDNSPLNNDVGILMALLKDEGVSNYKAKEDAAYSRNPDMFNKRWFLRNDGKSEPIVSIISVKDTSDNTIEELSIKMTATMDSDGKLIIDLENNDSSLGNTYKMRLKMQCTENCKLTETSDEDDEEEEDEEDDEEDEDVEVITTVKTRTYSFKLTTDSIEKG